MPAGVRTKRQGPPGAVPWAWLHEVCVPACAGADWRSGQTTCQAVHKLRTGFGKPENLNTEIGKWKVVMTLDFRHERIIRQRSVSFLYGSVVIWVFSGIHNLFVFPVASSMHSA